jgi:hypothetical protein
VIQLEATMIDPFFFDRLMHAFTTANSTPLSHAAAQAPAGQPPAESTCEATGCRALREAEAVVAEAYLRNQPTHSGTPQADSHA